MKEQLSKKVDKSAGAGFIEAVPEVLKEDAVTAESFEWAVAEEEEAEGGDASPKATDCIGVVTKDEE